ncbi:acetylglucosaminyltransferase [Volvox carteri f. nagariensis]|uniref:Acetylglucosaminyltransferase n=1 Tax=Volvox carteri f. nagariensis TaxID=3068 RepID=D8TIX0_VOLCA|nr:acetylglucosaminyltransferase [Volvox carteri f. nagariensis]EFJ52271.1 acetylglucosaminyltransferase [Volvox carteri f. nagariensis]|eukprot:XP_002946344.1 acetylglucosaminyltransferase [Volvox carteri f. nagariensis]
MDLVAGGIRRGLWGAQLQVSHRRQQLGFQLPKVKHDISDKVYIANRVSTEDDGHALRQRCALARGTWCGQYLQQQPLVPRPAPRGGKECPNACSGWGNCNYDTGICECPAGRTGADCGQELKRPCSNRYRHPHEFNVTTAVGHLGGDNHDLNPQEPGWLASRCYGQQCALLLTGIEQPRSGLSGYCLDDIAMCTCGLDSKYRHWGRPMTDSCMIGHDKDGAVLEWGRPYIKYDDVYGPNGWCNSPKPVLNCGCAWDGNAWPCDGSRRFEPFCVNQCTGHGDCYMGFCRCHPGWYGQDCSRKKAGMELDEGYLSQRPWLRGTVVVPPASLPEPQMPTQMRPLIYVYDMPPAYHSRMLQYRIGSDACMWRRFSEANDTYLLSMTYSVEVYLHEMMLQSEHRTFDPEEADFFYVPMYITCFMWPVMGWADFPWWHAPLAHTRPMHVSNMILEAYEWLSTTFPWWNRRGGRDHIWLMAPDEGACYMPTVVYNSSIILTHWGRMDPDHKSGSAFDQDIYDKDLPVAQFKGWRGLDWMEKSRPHLCYNPEKDLVIPAFKSPDHFQESPLLGAPPLERDILLYFRGDVGEGRRDHYSRGIRQKLFQFAHWGKWAEKYKIYIGTGETIGGSYSEHLARSKFCLVAPGDGWSARAEDAILHGCVPLVVMDGVHAVFESILDWDSFSIRIREDNQALQAIPELLTAISPERLAKMQRNLARVWHRFAYATGPVMRSHYRASSENIVRNYPREILEASYKLSQRDSPLRPVTDFPFQEDAFSTIMQWLYHRIDKTR